MGTKLPPEQMALYRRVDEILFYVWDPIGVSHSPWGRDEYQSYLPTVFDLVMREAPVEDFLKYFKEVRGYMGLSKPNDENDKKVAELLLAVKRETKS